jgi:hypothetical protein
MKTLAILTALVAISSAAGAAEKPITLTCSGTWKSDSPVLGKRDGSVNRMTIAIDLNTRTAVFDSGVVGADKDVKHITRATRTRIEYGGETVQQGGKLNERGVFDRTTGTLTGSSLFLSDGKTQPAGKYVWNSALNCTGDGPASAANSRP